MSYRLYSGLYRVRKIIVNGMNEYIMMKVYIEPTRCNKSTIFIISSALHVSDVLRPSSGAVERLGSIYTFISNDAWSHEYKKI
jgi:hypothetical protein